MTEAGGRGGGGGARGCGETEHGSHCPCFLPFQNPSRLHPAEDGSRRGALAGGRRCVVGGQVFRRRVSSIRGGWPEGGERATGRVVAGVRVASVTWIGAVIVSFSVSLPFPVSAAPPPARSTPPLLWWLWE